MLVTTPRKEARLDILRRSVAAASLGANRAQLEAQMAAQDKSTEKSERNSTVGSASGGATGSAASRKLGGQGVSDTTASVRGSEASAFFPDAPIPVSERSGPQGPESYPGFQSSRPQDSAEQRKLQSAGRPGQASLQRGVLGGGRGEREEEEGDEEDDEEGARGPAAVWEEYAAEEAWDLDRGSEGEGEGEGKRRKVKRRVPAAPLQLIVAQADDIVAVSPAHSWHS